MTVNASLVQFVQKKSNLVALASVASFAAGAGSAYFVLSKKVEAKYVLLAEQEIAEAKRYYATLNKEGKFGDPVTVLEEIVGPGGLNYTSGHPAIEDETEEEEETLTLDDGTVVPVNVLKEMHIADLKVDGNVFRDAKSANSHFDYDEELPKRDRNHPYVITDDEFYAGEKDYIQSTVTWYEGDGVLVDDRNEIIDNVERTVGEENLERFGHGSKDPNVLHIRNEIMDIDFEVVKDKGTYVREVLGFDTDTEPHELKHSHRPKNRKFRGDDE